jgi:hypothetical protein
MHSTLGTEYTKIRSITVCCHQKFPTQRNKSQHTSKQEVGQSHKICFAALRVSLVPDNQSLPRCFILYLSNFYPCRVSSRRLSTWTITMKIISFFFLCALMVPPVHSHGTDVQHCVTAEGKLRIFVAHWHNDGLSTSSAGSMTIQQNHLEGQPSITLNPTGTIDNKGTSSLPGCEGIATRTSTCASYSENDWVWYDFPTTCNIPVNYTIISGNTVYLEEACSGLYPATISGTFSCPSAMPSDMPSDMPSYMPSSQPSPGLRKSKAGKQKKKGSKTPGSKGGY